MKLASPTRWPALQFPNKCKDCSLGVRLALEHCIQVCDMQRNLIWNGELISLICPAPLFDSANAAQLAQLSCIQHHCLVCDPRGRGGRTKAFVWIVAVRATYYLYDVFTWKFHKLCDRVVWMCQLVESALEELCLLAIASESQCFGMIR